MLNAIDLVISQDKKLNPSQQITKIIFSRKHTTIETIFYRAAINFTNQYPNKISHKFNL